jgi:hypothetical protein
VWLCGEAQILTVWRWREIEAVTIALLERGASTAMNLHNLITAARRAKMLIGQHHRLGDAFSSWFRPLTQNEPLPYPSN